MSDNETNNVMDASGLPVRNEADTEPFPLEVAIREIVRKEEWGEEFSEKAHYLYADNGKIKVPRSNLILETDQDRVLLVGADDYLFKEFAEGVAESLFRRVTQTKAKPWVTKHSRHPGVQERVFELTKLGQEVLMCRRLYNPTWQVAYTHHVFRPSTTLMLRAMRGFLKRTHQSPNPDRVLIHDEQLATAIDWLVRFVRRVNQTWRFINAVKAHERQAQDNFDSARELMYHYAEGCSKLLILRIDLFYKPYYAVEQADKAVNDFLRSLRSKACKRNLLPGYKGFLIKRENGLIRGMHWHVMIICDGNTQRSANYLTRQLGEMWAKRTGQGPGSYHNCYADKDRHEFNGLGLLMLDDWEKMAGLRAALWYMTKQDCVIRATNSKVKNFWRSPIPRKERKKRGRPRADPESLRLLQRMLGGKRSKFPPGIKPKAGSRSGSRSRSRIMRIAYDPDPAGQSR